MDVTLLSPNSLKLKISKTNLIFNPEDKTPKVDADAVIANTESPVLDRVKDWRVFINSSGEFEVGGLKVSSFRQDGGLIFSFNTEGTDAVLGNATTLAKIPQDKIREYGVAILNADGPVPQNVITAMEPRVIIVYGEKGAEAAKELGENVSKSNRVSIAENKLPEETTIYLLN